MKKRSTNCCTWCNPNGLTLVEVVAGMALMATLLVGILMAYGNHVHQIKRAQRKLEAIALADQLMEGWFSKTNPAVPITSGGGSIGNKKKSEKVNKGNSLVWRTYEIENRRVSDSLNLKIIRLEVQDSEAKKENDVLAAVEVVVSVASPTVKSKKVQ
jgi:type II secretory pathway pseudopilin PulG